MMSDDIITTEKDTKKKGTAKKGRGGKTNVGKKKLVKQHLGTITVGTVVSSLSFSGNQREGGSETDRGRWARPWPWPWARPWARRSSCIRKGSQQEEVTDVSTAPSSSFVCVIELQRR